MIEIEGVSNLTLEETIKIIKKRNEEVVNGFDTDNDTLFIRFN